MFYLDDIDNSGIDENAIETKVDYGENESDITKKEKESIYKFLLKFLLEKCNNCMGFGHYAKNCPKRECHFCHEFGHIAKNCPRKQGRCYNCGKVGHIAKYCYELVFN